MVLIQQPVGHHFRTTSSGATTLFASLAGPADSLSSLTTSLAELHSLSSSNALLSTAGLDSDDDEDMEDTDSFSFLLPAPTGAPAVFSVSNLTPSADDTPLLSNALARWSSGDSTRSANSVHSDDSVWSSPTRERKDSLSETELSPSSVSPFRHEHDIARVMELEADGVREMEVAEEQEVREHTLIPCPEPALVEEERHAPVVELVASPAKENEEESESPDDGMCTIGYYTRRERKLKIARYQAKKRRASEEYWPRVVAGEDGDIEYACRQTHANTRPRVGGRFLSLEKMTELGYTKVEGEWVGPPGSTRSQPSGNRHFRS